eukprot:61614_1
MKSLPIAFVLVTIFVASAFSIGGPLSLPSSMGEKPETMPRKPAGQDSETEEDYLAYFYGVHPKFGHDEQPARQESNRRMKSEGETLDEIFFYPGGKKSEGKTLDEIFFYPGGKKSEGKTLDEIFFYPG